MQLTVQIVREFLARHLPAPAAAGVAVSGGVDSVVLLDIVAGLAAETGLALSVLHYDHALRDDSAADADFVAGLARERGLPFHAERAAEDLSGPALENRAREARYDFFRRTAGRHGLAAVLIAHNANDQAETFLFRLLRGTGGRGLAGIPPVRVDGALTYLRPLLAVHREDIERYAQARALTFREDPTNKLLAHTRNRLRHQILPFLQEQLNPQIVDTLCRTSEILRSEEELIEELVAAELAAWEQTGETWSRALVELANVHPTLRRRVLLAVLERLRLPASYEIVERIAALAAQGGRLDLSARAAARVEGDRLLIGAEAAARAPVTDEFPIAMSGETEVPAMDLRIAVTPQQNAPGLKELNWRASHARGAGARIETAFLAADAVVGRLRLRTRRDGDRMRPLGLDGMKKLHDIFIDEKISPGQRERWPILVDDRGVLWLVGIRQDERTRVTPRTARILRIDVTRLSSDDGPELIA